MNGSPSGPCSPPFINHLVTNASNEHGKLPIVSSGGALTFPYKNG
jgi:hypothetical protein